MSIKDFLKGSGTMGVIHTAGDWLDGLTDLAQILGLGKKIPASGSGGKPSFEFDEKVFRKIPLKILGCKTDEAIWQNIEKELSQAELAIMDGWLEYLEKKRLNDDLIYFFSKSREELKMDEVIKSLRKIYLEVADEVEDPEDAYKLMTEKAMLRNIIKEGVFSKLWAKRPDDFKEFLSPFSNKMKGLVLNVFGFGIKTFNTAEQNIRQNTIKLDEKIAELKKRKKEQKPSWRKYNG